MRQEANHLAQYLARGGGGWGAKGGLIFHPFSDFPEASML